MCSGSMRNAPRRVSGNLTCHERSLREPSESARPARPDGRVVGLWTSSQGFGRKPALRSVYVTFSWSPTWPNSWLTA